MTAPRRLYVCGPMTGLPEFNFPAFEAAAEQLRAAGFDVECPTAGGQVDGWRWSDYMRRGLIQLLRCDAVAVLDGWEASPGANVEVDLAEKVDMAVQPVQFWLDRGPGEGVAGVPTLMERTP